MVNWFLLIYYYYRKSERDMVVSQEPAMGFSQNNFSLETSESKRVRFLAATTTRDTKWLRHFSGGLTRFHSFSAAFPIITCQCCESTVQSDLWRCMIKINYLTLQPIVTVTVTSYMKLWVKTIFSERKYKLAISLLKLFTRHCTSSFLVTHWTKLSLFWSRAISNMHAQHIEY